MVLEEYAQFGNVAAPTEVNGRMYFDGTDFWISA
jgi:hypothetical protein